VVDLYPDESVVAGSPLHVAAHLAAAGWTVYLVTRIGADADGDRVAATLGRHRLDSRFVERDPELPTGRVTLHLDEDDNRFEIHGPAAWDALEGPASLPPHDVFSYGTLAARSERSRATMERLLAASDARLRVLDANIRPPDFGPEALWSTLGQATTVKLNASELTLAAQAMGLEPRVPAFFAALPRLDRMCVTAGARGARLDERFGAAAVLEPAPTRVTNTVGAGDAFTAGLIDALAADLAPRAALEHAHSFALGVLTRRGGLPRVDAAHG
jgi:fructokinase